MDEYEEAVLFSFALLESRLDRLEYLLSGPRLTVDEKPKTIPDRIHNMEKALQELAGKTSLLADAQELLRKHKDVLVPDRHADRDSLPLEPSQKAILVVERATSFATTASQLQALEDQQVPTTDGFVKLAMLRPRIAEAENRHLQQALKISELRKRSGLVVQRYKQIHLVGAARCWVSWHGRCQKAYRTLAREEFKRRPEEEVIEGGVEQKSEDEVIEGGVEQKSEEGVIEGGGERKSEEEVVEGGGERKSEQEVVEGGVERNSEEEVAKGGVQEEV